MSNLLMITGLGSAKDLASGKKAAFYSTLEEFHQHWGRIDIVCPRAKGITPGEHVFFSNVHVHISLLPLFLHPFYFVWKSTQLHRSLKFALMTVQEFPPFYNGIGANLIHFFTGIPYILEVMHIPGFPRAASVCEYLYRWMTKLLIALDAHSARAVRVINKNQARDFLISAGVPEQKIAYIPAFYIDLVVFKPTETVKKFDVVYAARLEKNKGIINLIEAIAIAKNKKPNISLLIVGSGPLREKIELSVKKLALENNITFSGWLGGPVDVAEAYRSARIFINPSFNEGGPRVALEAMACGLPVITTRVGIMCDVIDNHKNGLFTDWSPKSMANTIIELLADEHTQRMFSEKGIELVQQFEKKKAIQNYVNRIKELI